MSFYFRAKCVDLLFQKSDSFRLRICGLFWKWPWNRTGPWHGLMLVLKKINKEEDDNGNKHYMQILRLE